MLSCAVRGNRGHTEQIFLDIPHPNRCSFDYSAKLVLRLPCCREYDELSVSIVIHLKLELLAQFTASNSKQNLFIANAICSFEFDMNKTVLVQ